jgi:dCTP deaminase
MPSTPQFLSDRELRECIKAGEVEVLPFNDDRVRPASICLTLSSVLKRLDYVGEIDIRDQRTYPSYQEVHIDETGFLVPPATVVLGATVERIALSKHYVGWLENLSGLARIGLISVLSHLVSPGFGRSSPSTITLELTNLSRAPIRVYAGMRICHLVVARLARAAERGYDEQVGNYSGRDSPGESVFHTEFERMDADG